MMKPATPFPHLADMILENAERVTELHERVRALERSRSTKKGRLAWEQACAAFTSTYDSLAFPGGYKSGLARIKAGEPEALEAALLFLEKAPYFYRSGFIRTKLLHMLEDASLSAGQKRRLEKVRMSQLKSRAGAQQAVAADVPDAPSTRHGRR